MDAMNRFVTQKNINRYRKLASESTDAAERSRIMKLLAEEYAKFKLERGARAASPKENSPVSTATSNRAEFDRGEKRNGG